MAAIFPYSTPATVSLLMASNPAWSSGFNILTKPDGETVEYFIKMVASAVDMRLMQAGYIIPLEALDGETWPESQTYFLDYLVGLGAAGLIGNTLRPAPAMGPGSENSPGNVFYQQYNTWVEMIATGKMGLRAKYRISTPAERFILSPLGPRWTYGDTEFSEMVDVVSFWSSAIEEQALLEFMQSFARSYRHSL